VGAPQLPVGGGSDLTGAFVGWRAFTSVGFGNLSKGSSNTFYDPPDCWWTRRVVLPPVRGWKRDIWGCQGVGWVDTWCYLSTQRRPTMGATLPAALSHEPRDGLVGWTAQAVRRPVSDEGGDMSMDLYEAAGSGDVTEVRRLVAAGADVNKQDEDGMRPLHVAATTGHVETVKTLVELGADKNAQDAFGLTPLHCAALKGHVETVKVLAQLGAYLGVQNARGETPLESSVRLGLHQVAQVLRELERTATRAQKAAATSARTRQPARQDTPETREAAERIAAELIEEEEREQAAQRKVRPAPP
jgi:hypothetical protein